MDGIYIVGRSPDSRIRPETTLERSLKRQLPIGTPTQGARVMDAQLSRYVEMQRPEPTFWHGRSQPD